MFGLCIAYDVTLNIKMSSNNVTAAQNNQMLYRSMMDQEFCLNKVRTTHESWICIYVFPNSVYTVYTRV